MLRRRQTRAASDLRSMMIGVVQFLPAAVARRPFDHARSETQPTMGKVQAEIREKKLQDELRTPDNARDWVKLQIR